MQSERLAALLAEQFEADLDASETIRPGSFARRGLHDRTAERAVTIGRRAL